ncbi:MAG TPA: hypothetical protein PKD51_05850 [Saprospiraceae bacterium]|nr:hypothetical protein [Saprospiraceae bacterium]HMU03090.1 hypothetical protein [Saprospiraceae bacterium]
MKIFSFVFLLLISFASCKNANTESSPEGEKSETYEGEKPETPVVRIDLNEIAQHVGKLPKEVDLFTKYSLDARIEKIMGTDYAEFKQDWNEETPLKKDGEVMYTTGCKAGDCKANRYLLVLDLLQNGVNVYNFRQTKNKTYEEDNIIIGLPSQAQADFEKILNEQKGM